MLRPVAPHRAVCWPCPLAFPWSGPLQAFLPPEPLHPLVVHRPALPPQQAVGHSPAPADVLSRDLTQAMPELGLLDRDDLSAMALGAAVRAHHDGPAATLRAQKFPSTRSHCFAEARGYSIAFSSSASASGFLSLAFSFSS
jgi:hypothetical protein